MRIENLSSFGRKSTVEAELFLPENEVECLRIVQSSVSKGNSIKVVGSKNNFSDILIQEAPCTYISLEKFSKIEKINGNLFNIGCGVKINTLLQRLLDSGNTLRCLPGSLTDTVGGIISSDSHGKDAWKYGNFSSNILKIKILTSSGEIFWVEKKSHLFKGLPGSLGYICIFLEVQLETIPLPQKIMVSQKVDTLSGIIDTFENLPQENTIACYAWINQFKTKSSNYQGILSIGRSYSSKLTSQAKFLEYKTTMAGISPDLFWKSIRLVWKPFTLRIVNSFRMNLTKPQEIQDFYEYYYPLRNIPKFNYLYNEGFVELQPLFSFNQAENAITKILDLCNTYKIYPDMCSIKPHRFKSLGHLSFNGNGVSITLNFKLECFLKKPQFFKILQEIVTIYEGRVYLGKYPYLNSEELELQYPHLSDFIELKKDLDPTNTFTSKRLKSLFE